MLRVTALPDHSSWYYVAKDFQFVLGAVVALVGAGLAYFTALKVASAQISEQRRKEADELLRWRCAATMQMSHIAGAVLNDLRRRKNGLSGFPTSDDLWDLVTPVSESYSISDSIVSHASLECQSAF